MAAKRVSLLAVTLAALVAISVAAAPTMNLDQEQPGVQVVSGYPHYPIIQLADDQNQMRLIELDGRVVEAIITAPASPGRGLLMARIRNLEIQYNTLVEANLYHFVLDNARPVEVLIPDAEFAVALHGLRDRVASGFRIVADDTLHYALASTELWGRDLAGGPVTYQGRTLIIDSVAFGVQDPQSHTYSGHGYLAEESIPIGRLLPDGGGHNPPGTDECIKLRTCELICDPPEMGD